MNEKDRLVKNTFIIAIGSVSTKLITFLLLPFYTVYLSNEDYGLFDYICVLTGCIIPIFTLLVDEAMFRFLVDCKNTNEKIEVFSNAFIIQILGMLAIAIIGYISNVLFNVQNTDLVVIFSLGCCLSLLINPWLRGQGLFGLYTIYNSLISFFIALFNVVFIFYIGGSVDVLIYINAFAHLLVSVGLTGYLKLWDFVDIRYISVKKIKEMIKFSYPLIPSRISVMMISVFNRGIIIFFVGLAAAGDFAVASKLSLLVSTVYGFFGTSWQETAARVLERENFKEFYIETYKCISELLWVSLLWFISIVPFIFQIMIDNKFIKALNYMPILLLSAYFSCLTLFLCGILSAFKDTVIIGRNIFVSSIVSITLGLVFTKFFGVYGVVIGGCIASYYSYVKIREYIIQSLDINLFTEEYKMTKMFFIILSIASYMVSGLYVRLLCVICITLYLFFVLRKLGIINWFKEKIFGMSYQLKKS